MESEQLLSYRKKVEQMTVLIHHYQNELESHKVRRDGVETVSRLLAEARQENLVLKKNQTALEMTAKNLQNRLAVNATSTTTMANDYEVIVPGTSKQTLTNLALENKRLRSMLQENSCADNVESLQKTEDSEEAQALQETIDQLEAENKSMKMKLSDLEALFKSSNNEKDRQLVQCQDEIQRLRQNSGEKTVTGEGSTGLLGLKAKLKTFMSVCEDFEMQLDKAQVAEPTKEETSIQLTPVTEGTWKGTDSMDGNGVTQLLEEKQRLQDKVEEVTKMNQRWQAYFTERDHYTQSLEKKVKDLEGRLEETMHQGTIPEINRRVEQMLEESRREMAQLEQRRRKSEEEAEQCRQEVAARDALLAQLQSQMSILARAPRQQTSAEASSIIDHLKAQIQVCTEDFEKERHDRQAALQKMASLQEHNTRLQKLNNHLQTLAWNQANQSAVRPAAQEHGYHDPYSLQSRHAVLQGQSLLAYDGPLSPGSNEKSQDFPDFGYGASNRDTVVQDPGPVSLPATTMQLTARGSKKLQLSLSDSALDSETTKQENVLTCPKCNKEFSEERQGELLAHMDVCWE